MAELDIFAAAEKRLDWIGQRQRVLATNIANADTPGYAPRDVPSFASVLAGGAVAPLRTNPLHLAGLEGGAQDKARVPGARAPDGNAVDLETEMAAVADDETSASLVGNLWKSYMGMFMTALGRAS